MYPTWARRSPDEGQGYRKTFTDRLTTLSVEPVVISRDPAQQGFHVQPRRWAVERFLAWITRARRLACDYERTVSSAEAWVKLTYIRVLLRRVTRPQDQTA